MITNILKIGGIGCLVFTCFIIIMSLTGVAGAMRDETGKFRKKVNGKTLTGIMAFISFLFGLLYIGNIYYKSTMTGDPGFIQLWLNSFGIFMVLHLYDLIVLDYLVVVKWHPGFLKLPDTDYYTTFSPHVKGFIRGIPMGLIASLLVSLFNIMAII